MSTDDDRGMPATAPSWIPTGQLPPPPAPSDQISAAEAATGQAAPGQIQPNPMAPGQVLDPPSAWSAKPPAMPDGPRIYQQLLRGPRQRWWKPILSILLFGGCFAVGSIVLVLLAVLYALLTGKGDVIAYLGSLADTKNLGPDGFAFTNLSLIILIPTAMFAVWAVHRTKPWFLLSVEGRFRWRWFARSLLVTVPLWVIYLGVGALLDPPAVGRPPHWPALLIIMIISTPFQCAAEEFTFRGFLPQVLGSWFRPRLAAVLVPLPFSVGLFALAHGSLHLWILVDLGSFALATYILMWRTGGLEAGIALHMTNNMLLFVLNITVGGWQDSFVQSDSTGSPGAALISLGVNALVTALLLWQAKRADVRRIYQPADAGLTSAQQAPVQTYA